MTEEINRGEPSKFLQSINTLLHTPPFSFLFNGVFWSAFLISVTPLIGIGYFLYTVLKTAKYLFSLPFEDKSRITPLTENKKQELAILITGCDSGFGLNAVHDLSNRGFVVFAGCYSPSSFPQFEGNQNIIPMQLDVTNKEHIKDVLAAVETWLNASTLEHKRRFYALINNAGICQFGLVDWLEIDVFRKVMEVNYFGMIQMTKSFLPILKSTQETVRIVNMISVAGFICGNVGVPYTASKHAAQAFTTILRNELKPFSHIKVIGLNPSFHKTPLIQETFVTFERVWNNLNSTKKMEYGQENYNALLKEIELAKCIMWDPKNVTLALRDAVELKEPPVQMLIGMDAKYFFTLLRMIPIGILNYLISPRPIAANSKKLD